MTEPTSYLEYEDRDEWRSWLECNHTLASQAWLKIFKKDQRGARLSLEEAVEEALCFGWIDGKLLNLDESSYILRFSPRKPNSIWSMSNIRRVEKLAAAGKMTPAGTLKVEEAKANGEWQAAIRREQVDRIPEALERALQKHAGGVAAYQALPDSLKKQYIYWLQQAKREETKQRRIEKIIAEILAR